MTETKQCQNCKNQFTIESEDFSFYEKISVQSGKVPPPTWCPLCRLKRRLMFRNERTLYKDTCGLCKKSIISMYAPGRPFPVYCSSCWRSDGWDPINYGREYDFSRPFLAQFRELFSVVPRMALFQLNGLNSEFSNFLVDAKNAYLSYSTLRSEDVSYSRNIDKSSRIVDCYAVTDSEGCYESSRVDKSYNCRYSLQVHSCMDSQFLYDCVNCRNCFLSSNLRNKQYYIRNNPYTKEEYKAYMEKINFGDHKVVEDLNHEFKELVNSSMHKYSDIINCVGSSGDALNNCKASQNCFYGYNLENCKNMFRGFNNKDNMDCSYTGGGLEMGYELMGGGFEQSSGCKFSTNSVGGGLRRVEYSDLCTPSSNLFGCIGIKSGEYSILNKRYEKSEYEELVVKIRAHMSEMPYQDAKGRVFSYGEFFPPELSPFAYNETLANEHFPITRREAQLYGYKWKESDARSHTPTCKAQDLPSDIADVSEEVLNEVTECANPDPEAPGCTEAFRITPADLAFYKANTIPLPRLCPNCRYFERLRLVSPPVLFDGACRCGGESDRGAVRTNITAHFHGDSPAGGPCPNTFKTPFAPDCPEIVYCETCYNAEIV